MSAPRVLETFHPNDLALYHRNPRVGNVKAIMDSLRVHTQYRPIVVNRGTHTGRPNEVLAGNHTLKAMRELLAAEPGNAAWTRVDAYVLDVDDDQAARIVLADNRTAELGTFDIESLSDLLSGLPDLAGTGYTDDDVNDMFATMEEGLPGAGADDDGLISRRDMDDKADTYGDVSTRVVVLQYPIAQFIWAQEKFAAYRKDNELQTNSDAVIHMLAAWSGETPPAADAEPPADESAPHAEDDI